MPLATNQDGLSLDVSRYASIERWPTVSLLPNQFSHCKCGHLRTSHRFEGPDRRGCLGSKSCRCKCFIAPAVSRAR